MSTPGRVAGAGLLLLALGAAGGAGWWLGRRTPDTAPVAASLPPAAAPTPAPPPVPDDGLGFRLGVNEGVSIPERFIAAGMTPEQIGDELAKDAALLRGLGARTVRAHTGAFPRISQWSLERFPGRLEGEGDAWVRAVQAEGLDPVVMISPWPGNRTAAYTDRYLPADLAAFSAYVARIVERYDGDGTDDMPGLRAPVRWFEVDNEPDLKFTDPPREGGESWKPDSFCTPAEYAKVLVAAAAAVHAASPEAKVVAPSLFRPHADSAQAWLDRLVAEPGVREAVDVASLHTYDASPDGARLAEAIEVTRAAFPGRPLWVTETSMSLGDGVDEETQARLLVTFVGRSITGGVTALYWHTLADPPQPPDRGAGPNVRRGGGGHFSTNSLLRTLRDGSREEKPVGTTYKALAAVAARHPMAGAVPDGEGAARLLDGSVLLWAGSRAAPAGGVNLLGGATIAPGGTAEAPAWIAAAAP